MARRIGRGRRTGSPLAAARALTALSLVVALGACGGAGADEAAGDPAPATGTHGDADAGGEAVTLHLTAPAGAAASGFAQTDLEAPADTPFTIWFHNDDPGIPHNVQIFEGTSTEGSPVWAPEGNAVIVGPDEVTYEIPALPAGTYTFNCLPHPTTMVGTLTVG
jgi:plastocyanin